MSANEVLSQDEIDALLGGVDNGEIETDTDDVPDLSVVRNYDFSSQDRVIRGRFPVLRLINERFARNLRHGIFEFLRHPAEVTMGDFHMMSYEEHIQSMFVPTSLNLIRIGGGIQGTGLFVVDPNLVFILVDNYFGGNGQFQSKIEGRDFTPTELRVVHMLLNEAFSSYSKAWDPVLPLKFEFIQAEMIPQFANIASPGDTVIVNTFHIELDGGGGDFMVTLPYSMIEPISEMLNSTVHSESDAMDQIWNEHFREGVFDSEVEVVGNLIETSITLRELLDLKPGDVIPVDLPEIVSGSVEGLGLFDAIYGESDGKNVLQLTSRFNQPGHESSLLMPRKVV